MRKRRGADRQERKTSWTDSRLEKAGGSSEKRWPPPHRVPLERSCRSDKMLPARMLHSSLFLINYYQSINMKKDEYPDYVFWTLYLLVVVCLTIICRSIRQILFSVLCMSAVSVGLGYWLIEKNESIRYFYNLGIPTTFIGLSLLVHVIPLFVCLFRSNKKNVEKA